MPRPPSFDPPFADTTPALAEDLSELLARTPGLWAPLAGARVLLTGGTGFVGRWMLEALAAADAVHGLDVHVTVVTRAPEAFRRRAPELAAWRGLALVAGDVRDFGAPAGPFEHVVHAAVIPTPPTTGREILDVILRGTRHVLDVAVAVGARRLLVVGSGAVYGPQPPDLARLPEDFAGAPPALAEASANGEGKRAAELMAVLEGRARGFAVTLARGFALLGPFLPLDGPFAAGNFVRDALAGGPIVVQGDGTARRSYLYAADLAEWLWTIHLRGRDGAAYNVGGADEVSIAELAHRVARAASSAQGSPIAVRTLGRAPAGAAPARFVPAVDRAREELGLVPTVGLDEGIRRLLAFARGVA